MFQRRIKDSLPTKIRDTNTDHDDVRHQLRQHQMMQKDYHDRSAKDLPPLIPGQQALVRDVQNVKWSPAIVKAKAPEPRSYIIETPSGQKLRRNRVQLKESKIPPTGTSTEVPCMDREPPKVSLPPCATCPLPATPPGRLAPKESGDSSSNSDSKELVPRVTRHGRTINTPMRYR